MKHGARTYNLPNGSILVKQTKQCPQTGAMVLDRGPTRKHLERFVPPGFMQIPEVGIAVAEAHLGKLKEDGT